MLSECADRVAGQLPGDKECAFNGVTKSGSLEEGAGKRYSEYVVSHVLFYDRTHGVCFTIVSPIRQLHQITSSWPKLVFAKTRTSVSVSMSTGMAQSVELHVDSHVLVALGQDDGGVGTGGRGVAGGNGEGRGARGAVDKEMRGGG